MNLYFRLIGLLLRLWLWPKARSNSSGTVSGNSSGAPSLAQDFFGTSILPLRVWPNDIDPNLHMNNGRYLTIMDLGRITLMAETGILPRLLRREWLPVVACAMISFKRSLDPWQKYQLHTRVLGFDEKWFFIEQKFVRGDKTHAHAIMKGLFLTSKGQKVTPLEVLSALGHDNQPSPALPNVVVHLQQAEQALLLGH